MIIIRPITKKDQEFFVEFSFSGTLGFRNLPRDKDKLEQKILNSERSLARKVTQPGKEEYLFVLEDLSTGRIGGTCGILATADAIQSLNFKLSLITRQPSHPSMTKEIKILKIAPPLKQVSEVCSLYLQPTFRHSGQGRLLSLSRFLFMASHRPRFHRRIIAELRGYIDQRQVSPFWEALGRHFCDLSFVELMTQLDQGTIDIHDILPPYPIYISLLPKEVQEIIGKTHEMTLPAYHMLQKEGFVQINLIDAIEAGPTLMAPTSRIRSIRNSHLIKVELTSDSLLEENEYILANSRLDFRACYGNIQLKNSTCGIINQSVAEALEVKKGEIIRYTTLH